VLLDELVSSCIWPFYTRCSRTCKSNFCFGSLFRPPATLLRQEIEGTRIYLTVLIRTAIQGVSNGGDSEHRNDSDEPIALRGEEQMLREESERCFTAFCGRILTEVATLQPGPFEIIQAEAHQSLMLRSPVTVQVRAYFTNAPPSSFAICYLGSTSKLKIDSLLRGHFKCLPFHVQPFVKVSFA
jgi:hypothetical protein